MRQSFLNQVILPGGGEGACTDANSVVGAVNTSLRVVYLRSGKTKLHTSLRLLAFVALKLFKHFLVKS